MNATLEHILASAKAYAALIGSLLTAIAAIYPPDALPSWTPIVLAVLTAIATYSVPNTAPVEGQ